MHDAKDGIKSMVVVPPAEQKLQEVMLICDEADRGDAPLHTFILRNHNRPDIYTWNICIK